MIAHLVGTIGEHPIDQPRFGVDLDDAEREAFPGLRAALTGIPIDAKQHAIEVTIADDHSDENLRGRTTKLVADVVDEFRPDTKLAVTIPTVDPHRGRLFGLAVQLPTLVRDEAGNEFPVPHAEWSVRTVWR